MEMINDNIKVCKAILVGDPGVGKICIKKKHVLPINTLRELLTMMNLLQWLLLLQKKIYC